VCAPSGVLRVHNDQPLRDVVPSASRSSLRAWNAAAMPL